MSHYEICISLSVFAQTKLSPAKTKFYQFHFIFANHIQSL